MRKLLLIVAVITVSSGQPCPDGSVYNTNFNSCYMLIQQPEGYSEAVQNCVNDGGHLVSVENEEENLFVAALAQSSSNPTNFYFWIGATESSSNYTKWASGQNSLSGCAALTPFGGLWAKVDCNFNAPYICKTEPTSCSDCPTCQAPHSYCDSEWTYLQSSDSCYKGFFGKNWNNSEATCVDNGSHLASIHSDEENEFIFNLVTMGVNGTFDHRDMTWFGLRKRVPGTTEDFFYTDGTLYNRTIYSRWADGEPNNSFNEDCAELTTDVRIVSGKNYTTRWNDANCDGVHRSFICKKRA